MRFYNNFTQWLRGRSTFINFDMEGLQKKGVDHPLIKQARWSIKVFEVD